MAQLQALLHEWPWLFILTYKQTIIISGLDFSRSASAEQIWISNWTLSGMGSDRIISQQKQK